MILRQSKQLKATENAEVSSTNPIPQRLKEARLKANLSQRTLGIMVGFDPASASSRMNHYEKGRHLPDIDALRRMAEKLNVPLNYFFCDDRLSAELAVVISRLTEEERGRLLKGLKQATVDSKAEQ